MLKLVTVSALLGVVLAMVDAHGDIGPGLWNMKYINKCEEDDKHLFKFNIEKKKINRTHDGIDARMTLEANFTDEYGIRIDICKDMDGGCKPYQVIWDTSIINFVRKYAEENARTFLGMANLHPPDFPIPAGTYEIKEFMFNNEELPTEGPFGEFCARAYMLSGTQEVGCIEIYTEFMKEEDCQE